MSINVLTCLDAYCDKCKRSFGDRDEEPATAPGVGHWNSSPREARRDMATYGWKAHRRDGRLIDVCPQCASESEAK